jgi:outer membrane protein OmpA-like peptidoglycan-associated protein
MFFQRLILAIIFIFFSIALPLFPGAADCEKAKAYVNKALTLDETAANLIKKAQLYREAIKHCTSYAEAHNNLGDVYEKQGRLEEAIAAYKKALEHSSTSPYPYFGLGDIYYKTNRPEEAMKWYKKGLQYKPGDKLTLKRLKIMSDIQETGVVKSETIKGMLARTRGVGQEVSVTFGEGLIPFDFNKYNIRPDARPQLDEIGKALRSTFAGSKDIVVEKREQPLIDIAGHTDTRGTDAYNLTLSKKRAESVILYLVKNFKIPAEKLSSVGYGERVPLCSSGTSGACHALNRRVEIVLKPTGEQKTRSVTYRSEEEPEVIMDTGFFFQKSGSKMVEVLKEDSRLRSGIDRYFIFFRPLRDCYVYLIQEDSKGSIALIFPGKGSSAYVKRGNDYWVPGFGRAFTLDETRGEEKIFLVAASWPLESEIEGLSLKDQVKDAVMALKTRAIMVVKPTGAQETVSPGELDKKPQKIEALLERIEGKGGWVKVVRFKHE